MEYTARRRSGGDVAAAFGAIETTLLPNGFRITHSDANRVTYRGRGMTSTKENPLRGATEINVDAAGGSLRLTAQLGGVRFLALFVCLFPLLLWAALAGAAALQAGDGMGPFEGKALAAGGIWLVIGPLMAVWIRKRTVRALDDMMDNAAAAAERATRVG